MVLRFAIIIALMTFCHFYLTMARAEAQNRKKCTSRFPNKLAIAALNAA